jgi:hypothetical protein
MKALLVAFGVAATAFAGSSLYLWHELDAERDNAAQVLETTRKLNARVAELERSRTHFEQQRLNGNDGSVFSGSSDQRNPPPPPPAAGFTAQAAPEGGHAQMQPWTETRPERSAAFQKMMKANMRANNKQMYADVGSTLGLDKETTNKLIDLLTEQQLMGFGENRNFKDADEARRHWEQVRRDHENAISDLIGADKVMALQDYQQTLPARQEFESLARQLQGSDITLSPEQSKKLLAVYIEERGRVPSPQFSEGTDAVEYARSIQAWQDDYNKRIGNEANQILNGEQLAAYNDLQQMQKEMREQFAAMAASAPPGARIRHMGPGGTNLMFSAAPAIGISTVIENAPPVREEKKP